LGAVQEGIVQITSDEAVKFFIRKAYEERKQKRTDRSFLDAFTINFSAALSIAKQFGISRTTAGFVVRDYVRRSRQVHRLFSSVDLPEMNTIFEFVEMGVSERVKQLFLEELVRSGNAASADRLSAMMNLSLGRGAVESLVRDYNQGASRSDHHDKLLIGMARRHLSGSDVSAVVELVHEGTREFHSHIE
jgi:hypothetical protein